MGKVSVGFTGACSGQLVLFTVRPDHWLTFDLAGAAG
jgi:hypothetical protein